VNHLSDNPPDGATTFLDVLFRLNGDGLGFFYLKKSFVVSVSADKINESFFYPTNSIQLA
jgi:hypothetical protein